MGKAADEARQTVAEFKAWANVERTRRRRRSLILQCVYFLLVMFFISAFLICVALLLFGPFLYS